MSFHSVFIAVVIAFALIFAAFLLNRARPKVEAQQPTADLVRAKFTMSRDGLLPGVFSQVDPNFRTSYLSTWIAAAVVGIPGGVGDFGTFADLSNIGTLFAFVVVSAGVIVLRRKQPARPRGIKVPPSHTSYRHSCLLWLNGRAPLEAWLRFIVWRAVGLAI